MQQAKPTTLKTTLFWANLSTKNEMSGKYQVDLSNLSDAAISALEERGLQVKSKDDDRGSFLTVKSTNPIRCRHCSVQRKQERRKTYSAACYTRVCYWLLGSSHDRR